MAGPAILKIEVLTDAKPAQQGFSDVDTAATTAAKGVDKLTTAMDRTETKSRSMDDVADRVDEVGGSSGKAATGLNDLAGVFDLIGAGAFGEKMGIVSTVLDAGAGAADLFTVAQSGAKLAMDAVANSAAFATIKTIAYNIASKAVAVATGIWTAAQWLLNVALNANPIGLVVLAVLALIAVIILIVKNFDKLKAVAISVWSAITDAVGRAWQWLKRNVFDKIGAAVDSVIGWFKKLWTSIKGFWDLIMDKLSHNVVVDTIKDIVDWIQKLIDKLSSVHLPKWLTDLNPFASSTSVSAAYVFSRGPAVAAGGYASTGPLTESSVSGLARTVAAGPVVVNVILDGKRVGGYVDRIITGRLDDEGFALAAGAWGT
jgi:F0F1-type ATP synthase assembly protein I